MAQRGGVEPGRQVHPGRPGQRAGGRPPPLHRRGRARNSYSITKRGGLEALRFVQFLSPKEALVIAGVPFPAPAAEAVILNVQDGSLRPLFQEPAQGWRLVQGAVSLRGQMVAVTSNPQYQVALKSLDGGKTLHRLGDPSPPPVVVGWGPDSKAIAWGTRILIMASSHQAYLK